MHKRCYTDNRKSTRDLIVKTYKKTEVIIVRFAICDDEMMHAAQLAEMLRAIDDAIRCESYTSGETLVADIESGQSFDAIFLDMEMPGMDGIAAGNAIRALDERVILVFVTSHEQYAVASFQCEPLDYLIKPVDPDRLRIVLEKIQHKTNKKRTVLTFEEGGEYVRLYSDEIVYCESSRNYAIIHTKDALYRVRMTSAELEARLEPGHFARCHRSYIVNLEEVKKVDNEGYIHLHHSKDTIPVGAVFKKEFLKALMDYEMGEGF